MNRAALVALAEKWESWAAESKRLDDWHNARADGVAGCAAELRALLGQPECPPHDWFPGKWTREDGAVSPMFQGGRHFKTDTCAKCGATSTEER